VIDERHDFSFANMGRPRSYTFYGPNWARVSAPAFRHYKAFPTEGGVRTAAFATFPGRFADGAILDEMVLAKDLAPTVLQLADVGHPGVEYAGRKIEMMTGESVLGLLETGKGHGRPRQHADEMLGKKGLRHGRWKLVQMPPPFGTGKWELYDLAVDLAEQHDLAGEMPDKVAELASRWEQYASDNGVILPDWVSGY
jgi:arylsulfatase